MLNFRVYRSPEVTKFENCWCEPTTILWFSHITSQEFGQDTKGMNRLSLPYKDQGLTWEDSHSSRWLQKKKSLESFENSHMHLVAFLELARGLRTAGHCWEEHLHAAPPCHSVTACFQGKYICWEYPNRERCQDKQEGLAWPLMA